MIWLLNAKHLLKYDTVPYKNVQLKNFKTTTRHRGKLISHCVVKEARLKDICTMIPTTGHFGRDKNIDKFLKTSC